MTLLISIVTTPMNEHTIKELKGFSGSKIYLMKNDNGLFIRKMDNVDRNFIKLNELSQHLNVPKIYSYNNNILDMEYIHGLDMKSYLAVRDTKRLTDFLISVLSEFSEDVYMTDYTDVYIDKLKYIKLPSEMLFTKEQLLEKLPKRLPRSKYFGDLTLENIIYGEDGQFHLLDGMTSEYDSYIFDIAKLRQDLECKWFLRDTKLLLDVKVENIQDKLLDKFELANNNHLLILMLLRVYRYTKPFSKEEALLVKEMNRLWK
jgi:RIO-like serine/threonine protein kinase